MKSLYGLKQAPKQWHEKFDETMLSNGFAINESDKCVYIKYTHIGYVIVCLYVDDLLILGNNKAIITSTKDMLSSRFDMKDLGLADVILGVKILRTPQGYALSQSHYITKILEKFKQYNVTIAKSPVDMNQNWVKNTGDGVYQLEYSRILGSIMYVMNCTRPDNAYAANKLSRFTSNPGKHH